MKIRELEKWLIELKTLNPRNRRLREEADALLLLLIHPERNISKINLRLNNLIEIANPYLPKGNLMELATEKENFEVVLYPGKMTAGMVLQEIRKDQWKDNLVNPEFITELKKAVGNHKAKLNSIFSRYNPFLSSPDAKIRALEMFEDYLNRAEEIAPAAKSVHELIMFWKNASLPPNTELIEEKVNQTLKESESFAVTIAKHRNVFFNETRNINTSTEDFINSIDNDYGNQLLPHAFK